MNPDKVSTSTHKVHWMKSPHRNHNDLFQVTYTSSKHIGIHYYDLKQINGKFHVSAFFSHLLLGR